MFALVHAPRRLVVTTNYDSAIEKAVQALGLTPRTLSVTTVNEALRHPAPGTVHVLHIHGVANEPNTIVLTTSSYGEMMSDERLALALRQLATQTELVFLGHSLSTSERDIRRHLDWASQHFPGSRNHFLLQRSDEPQPSAPVLHFIDETLALTRVQFTDPDHDYEFTRVAARVIGGTPPVPGEDELPVGWRFSEHVRPDMTHQGSSSLGG